MKLTFMREAIGLSLRMMRRGKGGPFGAVVVCGNKIVGRGCNLVIDVNDGDAAIDYLTGNGAFADRGKYPLPCLLLLDLSMPAKTGFEVLRWIRAHPRLKTLSVVIVSGSNQERDVEAVKQLGITDYLVKPTTLNQLTESIRARLSLWLPETATGKPAS